MNYKKPRILYIATFPPPVHGSAVVSMQIKNSKLINNEFKGDYVNLGTSRKMDEIGKGGIILNTIKFLRFIGTYLRTVWLLLTHHYDLCYCAITINGVGFLKDAPYVMLCHLFGRKVVIHQHNKGLNRFVNRPLYKWLYRKVYHNAKVILLSEYLFDDISAIVDKKYVMICHNGIKPTYNEFKNNMIPHKSNVISSERIILDKGVPHILFLSNLIESKGCLELLKACEILKKRDCLFFCDFVGGDTKEISETRFNLEIVNRGLNDCVKYHGRKYGSDKDLFWSQTSIFVFPTYYYNECFPLVLLEAMEKSVACISTDEGGIRDIIINGETGYIVPKQNPFALANAIEQLLKKPLLCRQMGEAAHKLFIEKFTEAKFEKTMLKCLKKSME